VDVTANGVNRSALDRTHIKKYLLNIVYPSSTGIFLTGLDDEDDQGHDHHKGGGKSHHRSTNTMTEAGRKHRRSFK